MTVPAATRICYPSTVSVTFLICPLVYSYSCPPVALAQNPFFCFSFFPFSLILIRVLKAFFGTKSFTKWSVNLLTQLYYNSMDLSILLKTCENILHCNSFHLLCGVKSRKKIWRSQSDDHIQVRLKIHACYNSNDAKFFMKHETVLTCTPNILFTNFPNLTHFQQMLAIPNHTIK